MRNEILLFCIVFVPVIGSFILPLIGSFSKQLRNLLALVFVLTSVVFSFILLPEIISGGTVTINYPLISGISFTLHADMLAVFMAIASSLIGSVIVLYSFGYISHYENQNEYYMMVVLFLGSMMGLVFSGNLIFLFLFWEITTIACWRLIGFFRGKIQVLRADKAFLITVFGALIMLVGFVMLYSQTGSFDLLVIKNALKGNPVSNIVVMLILFGILSKSATLPFHSWLPDAGVAPSPVTALLHAAVLVKIGVYVFARLFISTLTLDVMWHTVVPVIAGLSMLVSAGAAFIETDLKRILAYSTISQISFIFLGLATGNEIGIAGSLLYILMHGLAKGGLFLCAGIVEQNTGTKDITKLGGLIKTMPVTAIAFLFCAFSVMGIPPFGGFFSKYMVITGAINNGQLAIALTFFAGAILTILYLLRVFTMVFLGDLKISSVKEKSATMVSSVAVLAILSLAGGIFIKYPSDFVVLTVQQMLGIIK
jgi:NADH:ubiquinone oxidoreductase subunit 5 (subunit L)/multisubunit Na+/H+ antiporter MnhA subunit